MKNSDKLFLIVVCISVLMVTANPVAKGTVEKAVINLGDTGDLVAETLGIGEDIEEAVVISEEPEPELISEELPEKKPTDIITEDFVTVNGRTLTLGRLANFESETVERAVSLRLGKEVQDFIITIDPFRLWSYAEIDGIVIIPKQTAIIDPYETSYYPSGEELVVKINATDLHELYIYTGKKGAPSLIIPKTSVSWDYDSEKKLVIIKSKNVITDEIVMFWVGFPTDDGTIFLEDRQKIEELNYMLGRLGEEKLAVEKDVTIGEEKLDALESEFDELEFKIEKVGSEKATLEASLAERDLTAKKLENIMTAHVALAPSLVIIWVIVSIILFILILDLFLFRPRRRARR